MSRWKPNALERLREAAIELFEERGYEGTTVADISSRAGLTERTFFRYFSDKREVLFSGSEELGAVFAGAMASAPKTLAPLEVVAAAFEAASPLFEPRRASALRVRAIVAAHPELRERELMKTTMLAKTIASGLQARGAPETTAALLALTGLAVFQTALERWISDAAKRDLAYHVRDALLALRRELARVGDRSVRRPSVRRTPTL